MSGIKSLASLMSSVKSSSPKSINGGLQKIKKDGTKLIFFPDGLLNENLENKRMYITIYDSKSVDDIEKQLRNTADKAIDSTNTALKSTETLEKLTALMSSISKEVTSFKGVEKLIIALPLPNELSDSQTHGFSTDTGIVSSLATKFDPGGMINKAIGQIANNLSTPRVLANPGYFQNYTGSEPRSFSFSFKLIPNSSKEANTIIDIITTLKKYSSPDLVGNAILLAPSFFHFWFSNSTLQLLTGIRPCIITEVGTNYAGSGILETTFDGMPKQIDLTISIKELRTITKDKWVAE